MELETNNQHVSSILTANKMCLKEGSRLATPLSATERDAMMMFARDSLQPGSDQLDLRVFSGLQYFSQSQLETGREGEDGFIVPWSDSLVSKAVGQTMLGSFFTENMKCLVMRSEAATGNIDWEASDCLDTPQAGEARKVFALCELRNCGGCVFPFSLGGRSYSSCVRVGSPHGAPWCSTKVDEAGRHVGGHSQPCPSLCPVSDCPLGLRPHLATTCLQESASSPEDDPASVSQAEEECLQQGGRLYQPRSLRALEAAKLILPRVYSGARLADPVFGIHSWATGLAGVEQNIAIGLQYSQAGDPPGLQYRDGSKVPTGLVSAGLSWASAGSPPSLTNQSCLTLRDIDKLTSSDCDFSNKAVSSLSYICEARPALATTVEGPLQNPGQVCVFPFRLEAGGAWRHSCVYEPLPGGDWSVWCPTEVDSQGVVLLDSEGARLAGTVGDCEDERKTVWAGPDADNSCQFPFFYSGQWWETCTLQPRDQYWCPTKVDPVTREMLDRK